MAIKELFYDQRPIALLDPRASQRIDPRFTFSRNSIGTYVDRDGIIKTAPANIPRLEYNSQSLEANGLLLEKTASNYYLNSNNPLAGNYTASSHTMVATSLPAPDGSTTAIKVIANNGVLAYTATADGVQQSRTVTSGTYKFSVFAKAGEHTTFAIRESVSAGGFITVNLTAGTASGFGFGSDLAITPYANGWYRISWTSYTDTTNLLRYRYRAAVTGDGTSGFYLWGFQAELGSELTSFIPTTNTTVTRAADLISVNSLTIPASGSIYIDARALRTTNNDTLLSLKNASNQKINLAMEQRSETYNSLALINTYSGTAKSSLPLPVPTTNRERNIITWGANNYQYTKDSSRFAPSLSTSVPANLTSLSIGHDSVDPTKAFNGYINSVYLYNGEIAPAIAEALVRGELNPVNADTYSPSGPAGSLALVINTQGASASGDKVFALPAESAANDNDLVITWGDGTESALELAAAEVGAVGLSHTYPSAGIYPVWVAGKMQNLYFNNSASAPDLLSIASWGTGQMFTSPSTMNSAFYGCSKLTSIASSGLPNTSAVTSWYRAFRGCSSLTGTFPSFDFSGATTLSEAFYDCNGLTAFPSVANQTQNVTDFSYAWYNCFSLTSFPLINTAAGVNFFNTWIGCSSLTSFPLINTSNGVNFTQTWLYCIGLTSFPLINTSSATTLQSTWYQCQGLTSFPLINTSNVSNFNTAWYDCRSLTSFPLINTGSGTDFTGTWQNCVSLTSFPQINTSSASVFINTWYACAGLTSFPLISTSTVTTFRSAWRYCSGLTSFPSIDTSAGTDFQEAWADCSLLASFPSLNTSAGVSFRSTWSDCINLTNFPALDTSSGTNFTAAWNNCNSLTSFPSLNFNSATGLASDAANTFTGFRLTWNSCDNLTNFPAGRFNTTTCTRYLDAWTGCALTAQSIENILVSINAAGTSNGNLGIGGGTNAAKTTWSTAANTAYNALVARGWTITFNA